MAIGGVYTEALEEMACGRVTTEPAMLVTLAFLTENMGVMVTGEAPLIVVVWMPSWAFFPRVLRSTALLFTLPPRAVGAIVGMVGETLGRETGSVVLVVLPIVLNSSASDALAVMAKPAKRTVTTKIVRINFIS